MDDLSNRTLKGYEIRECVAMGGYGVVYRANQASVGREVAIKVVLPQHANLPAFIRRFEVEAQTIARLEHPHIVPLYDYWRDPDGAFLVMRWLLKQIAVALALAHRNGVVHGDVKPDNILLDEDQNAYLADFGIAKDLSLSGSTDDKELIGSASYTTPEQIRGEPVTARTDIYSLGLVLYEILVGEQPYPASDALAEVIHRQLNTPLPAISERRPGRPAALNEVLQTATAKDPLYRYASALRFASAFRAAIPTVQRRATQPLSDPLTERELEILELMVTGLSNQEIAQKLYLAGDTIKWYARQIYSKLDVHSRHQAVERTKQLVPSGYGVKQETRQDIGSKS